MKDKRHFNTSTQMSEPDIVINLSNLEELNILKARGLKKRIAIHN